MFPPSRKDFISLTLSDPYSRTYNNGKHRRQSYWRKWKQLSRLQRSLILFLLAVLLIIGLLSYPSLTHNWAGTSDREWMELNIALAPPPSGVRPVPLPQHPRPALEPQAPPEPHPVPVEGPGAIQAPRGPDKTSLTHLLFKKMSVSKRRPPSLQKTGNMSDTAGGEQQDEIQEDNRDKKVVSWRGAMIEADQGTDPVPSAPSPPVQKEVASPPLPDAHTNDGAQPASSVSAERQEAVRQAFRHAWRGYREHAWGHDELKPISKSYAEWFGLGLTLIDALDTMWILGLTEEFAEAREWVENELSFDRNVDVNLFETTIRILGGLLSTYHLTKDTLFLDRAKELGSRLMPAFKTPSKIPFSDVNLGRGTAHPPRWTTDSTLAEVTSVQLEFRELSHITQEPQYQVTTHRASQTGAHGLLLLSLDCLLRMNFSQSSLWSS